MIFIYHNQKTKSYIKIYANDKSFMDYYEPMKEFSEISKEAIDDNIQNIIDLTTKNNIFPEDIYKELVMPDEEANIFLLADISEIHKEILKGMLYVEISFKDAPTYKEIGTGEKIYVNAYGINSLIIYKEDYLKQVQADCIFYQDLELLCFSNQGYINNIKYKEVGKQ